jgi:hypothetical protein
MRGECFPSPVARHNLELHLCARSKLVRVPVEYRCVQEYVFAAVVRRDESVTSRMIELQDPAGNHTSRDQSPASAPNLCLRPNLAA